MVAELAATPTTACPLTRPNNDSDNTVTLSLFENKSCCDTAFQTTKIGNLNSCHNASGSKTFRRFSQDVGKNMFGLNTHVVMYAGAKCQGQAWVFSLTNKELCWTAGEADWKSFNIVGGAGAPSTD